MTPPAHSLISDYFGPAKRTSALALYSFGIPVGIMIGAISGGWIAENFSWRVAFFLVGLPGILFGLLIKCTVSEPVRGTYDVAGDDIKAPSLLNVFRDFVSRPVLFHVICGLTISGFASYGSQQFIPAGLSP